MKRHLPVLLAAMSAGALGQSSPSPPPTLIAGRADLLNTLKSANLKPGDLFYLRTLGSWQQGSCTITSHTTITGHVESLTSSARPATTILALRFSDVPCAGSTSALMTPLLIALKAPDPSLGDRYNPGAPETPMLSGIFPSEVRTDSRPNVPTSNTAAATEALNADEHNQLHDLRASGKPMKTGEVRGYRGLALTLPGREGPATRLSSEHKIVLDRHTEFALAYASAPPPSPTPDPTSATSPPSAIASSTTAPTPTPPPPPPPPLPEMEDVCAATGCRELAAVAETASAHALWTLPLAGLGYQPRPQQPIAGLDHSAGVYFLGDDQILLTFTRHVLLPRSDDKDAWATNPRSVRGVLISRADGRILRVKDWTVADDIGPFAWGLRNGVVIAHVGHDLVTFGPGLAIQRRFRLPGALLFVSASPAGDLLLVATIHEKHTQQEHAQIASFVGPDVPIDEDYDLTGLNAAFQVTGARRITVPPLRPALLQTSVINLRPDGQPSAQPTHTTDWLLEENSWEGQGKPFAHVRSICPPQLQSLPGDLLFVQGCAPREAHTTWYRVLNAHGATLFKGSGPYSDFIQQTQSSDDGRLFAMATSHFDRPVDRTTPLLTGDFTNLTITVYDSTTGKQFFAAHPQQGSAQEDSFSLAPSGSTLAVLTSASLQLFPLPTAAAKK